MPDQGLDRKKLHGPELVEFAHSEANDTLSVIVELSFRPGAQPVDGAEEGIGSRPVIVHPAVQGQRDRMDELERRLRRLGAGSLLRLDAAGAFVLDATPDQLRAITLLGDVEAVRLNRTHHV